MKIYTKTGDKGETSLVTGRRVSKSTAIIEAYGTVDELNTFIGDLDCEVDTGDIKKDIKYIQNILFNIGSLLALDGGDFPNYPSLEEGDITYLERRIDTFNESLPKMTAFILPGGSRSIAKAHISRTVCRRAERRVIEISDQLDAKDIVRYLNRLSDYLFVLARWLHHHEGIPEYKWDNDIRDSL